MTPAARLNAAKSVFIKKTGPSDLAVKVFVNSLEGWGRYAIVDDAAKADLIIEIAQPEDTSGTTFSTSTRTNGPGTPHQEHSTTTTRQLSMQPIKVTVLDPRSNLPFWTAIERPAMAMRQTAKENNIAAAAQKIFDRFHAVVEAASRMGNRPQQ